MELDLVKDLNTTRKPTILEDVDVVYDLNQDVPEVYKEQLKKEIDSLPSLNIDSNCILFDLSLMESSSQYLVLVVDDTNEKYFVNTEGYDYPRYICQLKGF